MTAQERRGRVIVVATAVVGTAVVLALNGLALLQGRYHPILALKLFLWAAIVYTLWQGNEAARKVLIAVLGAAALACVFAAVVSGQAAVAAVALPAGVVFGASAVLLAGSAVGAFLRSRRGFLP
ncbi:MAG TPA: hypothetical protein VKE74_01930 [Gemmataceae bacterium]|nr:hypothetical protein [Gemmataceae bacterium]